MPRTIKSDLYDEKKSKPKDLLWQKRVYKKDDMREFFKLCKMLDSLSHTKHTPAGGGGREPSALQNCIVKCRFGKDAASHTRFLNEYLPQKNKSQVEEKPQLFSSDPVDDGFLAKYIKSMDGKHFRFIISPENQNVDTRALVKVLVKRMEAVKGRSFSWLAAVHTDTAHKHAHLLINGKDKNGGDITFGKVFIKQTIREAARLIATEMAGTRSREEIEAEKNRIYKSCRYCRLDDELRLFEHPLDPPRDRFASTASVSDGMPAKRLEHLAGMGLAERMEGKKRAYLLEKDWTEKLKAAGRYNSFLQARAELKRAQPVDMALYTGESGNITGVVTKLYYMNDEDSWNNAVLIENQETRKAWYVPLYYEPGRELLNMNVECAVKKNQKGLLSPHIRIAESGVNEEKRRHNRKPGEGIER
jgi:hypothetical protein